MNTNADVNTPSSGDGHSPSLPQRAADLTQIGVPIVEAPRSVVEKEAQEGGGNLTDLQPEKDFGEQTERQSNQPETSFDKDLDLWFPWTKMIEQSEIEVPGWMLLAREINDALTPPGAPGVQGAAFPEAVEGEPREGSRAAHSGTTSPHSATLRSGTAEDRWKKTIGRQT